MYAIIISVVVLLVVVTVIFSARFRGTIYRSLQLAGIIVQGAWRRAVAAAPGVGRVFMIIVGAAVATAFVSLVILCLLWLANVVIFTAVGFYVESPVSGFLLGVLLPFWSLLFILSKFPVIRRFTKVPCIISGVVIMILLPLFLLGVWSPTAKSSLNRLHNNAKQSVANGFDKRSLQTEAEAGTFGFLPEGTWVYNQYGQPFRKLPQGSLVRAMDLNGVPVQPDSEGLLQVMLPNETGDFVKGNTGYVPSRKIEWDWKGALASQKAEAKAKADREDIEREAAKIEAARNAAKNHIQETPEELRRRLKAIQRAKELRPGPDGLYHIGGGVPQPKPPVAVYVD